MDQSEATETDVIAQQAERINDTAQVIQHLEETVLENIGRASDGQP